MKTKKMTKLRLRFLVLALAVLVPNMVVFFHASTVQAVITSGASYCKSIGIDPTVQAGGKSGKGTVSNAPAYNACVQGVNGALANKSLKATCPTSLQGSNPAYITDSGNADTPFADCVNAYDSTKSINNTTPVPTAPTSPSAAAKQQCANYLNASYSGLPACEIGYDAAKKPNANEDATCAALEAGSSRAVTIGTAEDCRTGWALAKGIALPTPGSSRATPVASTEATSFCVESFGSGTDYGPCTIGYDAFAKGTSETDACKTFTASNLAACKRGFEDAQSAAANKKVTCDAGASALGWMICPAVDLLLLASKTIDNIITNQLAINTSSLFCTDAPGTAPAPGSAPPACRAYHVAWESFRNIALGLEAIVALVIVISQALGLEVLDAYTVKRALPRLLASAILITLSWPLVQFAITVSNDVGFGIRNLIYAPFSSPQFSTTIKPTLAGGFAGGVASFGAVAIFGLVGLLSFGATALISVLIAVIILILRDIGVDLLAVTFPIFLIAFVLPGTQKAYKFGRDALFGLLLVSPIINGVIAIGHVFFAVSNSNGSGALGQIIGFVGYFGSYLILPTVVQRTLGALGTIVGSMKGAFAGATRGLSQFRANKAKKNFKEIRTGRSRWDKNFGQFYNPITKKQTSLGHIANRAAINLFDQDQLIPFRLGKERSFRLTPDGKQYHFGGVPGTKKGSRAFSDRQNGRVLNDSFKSYQHLAEAGDFHYNGHRVLAGRYQDVEGETASGEKISDLLQKQFTDKKGNVRLPRTYNDFEKAGEIMMQSTDTKVVDAGMGLIHHAGFLATMEKQDENSYAATEVLGAIGLAAADRARPEQAAAIANTIAETQNPAVAQATLRTMMRVSNKSPDLRDGHTVVYNSDANNGKGQWENVFSEKNFKTPTARGAARSLTSSDTTNAKAEAIESEARTLRYHASGEVVRDAEEALGDEIVRQSQPGVAADPDAIERHQKAVQQAKDDERETTRGLVHIVSNPYNDPGGRQAAERILRDSNALEEDYLNQMIAAGNTRGARADDNVQRPQPGPSGAGAPRAPVPPVIPPAAPRPR